jgi:nucleoside-diphosphate-sugar epimerase
VRVFREGLKLDISREIFNIADVNITLSEFGEVVSSISGCTVRIIPEIVDRRSYQVDNSKAVRILGFKPYSLSTGIASMKLLSVQ